MSRRRFSPARAATVRPALKAFGKTSPGEILMDLLTFDRLLTGPVIHLIYWACLGLIVLGGIAVVGGGGLALNEPGWRSWGLAFPTLIFGLLALALAGLLWRSFCERYVALFQIAAGLQVMRGYVEQDHAPAECHEAPAWPEDS